MTVGVVSSEAAAADLVAASPLALCPPHSHLPVASSWPQTLAAGRPHGLYHTTENGQEFLYHMNDGKGTEDAARVIKTTLEGDIVWDLHRPSHIARPPLSL